MRAQTQPLASKLVPAARMRILQRVTSRRTRGEREGDRFERGEEQGVEDERGGER